MRTCKHCKITVNAPRKLCPLCQGQLKRDPDTSDTEEESFPIIRTYYQQFSLFFRILMMISIAACAVSVVLNLLFFNSVWWSFIVLAGIVFMWLTVVTAVKKRKNLPKNILYQIVLISLIVWLIDFFTGWLKWSVNYVIPALCLFSMIAIAVIAKIQRYIINEYAVYLLIDGIFCLAPLLFLCTHITTVIWPSLISIASSIVFLSGVLIFTGLNLKSELKRRLHL